LAIFANKANLLAGEASFEVRQSEDVRALDGDVLGSVVDFTIWRGFKSAGSNWALINVFTRVDDSRSCFFQHDWSG